MIVENNHFKTYIRKQMKATLPIFLFQGVSPSYSPKLIGLEFWNGGNSMIKFVFNYFNRWRSGHQWTGGRHFDAGSSCSDACLRIAPGRRHDIQ